MRKGTEEKEMVQAVIDRADGCPQAMLQIGEWYLDGKILRDETAAEAWLDRVIACGDSPEAVRAMQLIGERILHRQDIMTEEDYRSVCEEQASEDGGEKKQEFLEALKRLGKKDR